MHPTISKLLQHSPVILDGAWGTQLQERGLQPGACPELWNLDRPEDVGAVAASYVAAGSQIILTNTFGGNRIRLAEFGAENQAGQINRTGVQLSKQAAGQQALVFASVGPSGKLLCAGEVEEEDLLQAFSDQVKTLADAGADGLVIETMGEIEEAVLATRAAAATGLPAIPCMVFDCGADHDRTMMGTTPEAAAELLLEAGAALLGSNCGNGIEGYVGICERLHQASGRPVWMKPNAGLPHLDNGRILYHTQPEDFAGAAPGLVAAGAGLIGGCCGTAPAHIHALALRLRGVRQ